MKEKVKDAIEFLQRHEPKEGYYLAFSGGKDSIVCKRLLQMAGCKYEGVYRVTSVDPPELVKYIKEKHEDIKREVPIDGYGKPVTMWNLIPKRGMPPTYKARYCCAELKEEGGDGRKVVTGVRWEESLRRRKYRGKVDIVKNSKIKNIDFGGEFEETEKGLILINDNDEARRKIEFCVKRAKVSFNPIVNWTSADVWGFILEEKLEYCALYDEGIDRLGCIGCPLSCTEKRWKEFERWPIYKDFYIRAFQKLSDKLREEGKLENSKFGPNGETMFRWWMKD